MVAQEERVSAYQHVCFFDGMRLAMVAHPLFAAAGLQLVDVLGTSIERRDTRHYMFRRETRHPTSTESAWPARAMA